MKQLEKNPSKDTEDLNNSTNQKNLSDIYVILHPTTARYTFFSSAHVIYTEIDNILGHKTNLNKFKTTEIIQSMFSEHNGIKLEIKTRKIMGKFPPETK